MPRVKKPIVAKAEIYRIRIYEGWTKSQVGISAVDDFGASIGCFRGSLATQLKDVLTFISTHLYPGTSQVDLHWNGNKRVLWHLADGYWGRPAHAVFDGTLRKLYKRERQELETEMDKFSKEGLLYRLVK